MLRGLMIAKVGAVCAIATVALFVAGGVLMGSSGVEVLIPETGRAGREWIADVDQADWRFFAGAWLVVLVGFVGIVALIGFYAHLRDAGAVLVLAPVLGAIGLTLVTVSHLIPIAMAYELVPAYVHADASGQVAMAATSDTLASLSLVTNTSGNFLGWGVAVPMFAIAILTTRQLPRWLGWLGLVVAVLAGWLGLLSPLSSVIEAVSTVGFLAFFVFMISTGVAILLRQRRAPDVRATPATL